ncbi:MAG: hypothetical protein AAF599_12180 [Bacteroidota bacterium]
MYFHQAQQEFQIPFTAIETDKNEAIGTEYGFFDGFGQFVVIENALKEFKEIVVG